MGIAGGIKRLPLNPTMGSDARQLSPGVGLTIRNDHYQRRRTCYEQEPGRKEEHQEGTDQDTEGKERSEAAQEGRKKVLTM
jgi:hypothetical protein